MKNYHSILIIAFIALLGCEASKPSLDKNSRDDSLTMQEVAASEDEIKVEPNPSKGQAESETNASSHSFEPKAEAGSNSGPWSVTALPSYSEEEEVKVSFTNSSDETIILYNPMRKNVERLKNGEWASVNVVYCRCRPCPAPPETREIRPGKSYSVKWSKKEDGCNENKFTQSECKPGTYRISISYRSDGARSVESIEFKI
ncbi:hypothetical protein [Reichenbachiella sp.]|uniref:hypothetical protein n=1 Tax=Reichenbachiella sp. TaxID=2184521 RepID=UPI003BB219C5